MTDGWIDEAYGPSGGDNGGWVDDAIGPPQETSWQDYALGGLKGIAKSATDVFTAPANLLTRGGVSAINALTGSNLDTIGRLPSDYVNQFLDWESQGRGNQTTEDLTRLGGNLATLVAAPSQAGNLARGVTKAAPYIPSFLAKALGLGAEGVGHNALLQSDQANPFQGSELAAGLNIAAPGVTKVLGKAVDAFLPARAAGPMARAIQGDLQSITPGALSEAITPAQRAASIATSLEERGGAARKAAGQLFEALPEQPVILDDAINNIRQFAERVEGPVKPGSATEGLLGALMRLKPADEVINIPPSSILDEAGRPMREGISKVIPGGPAVVPLNQVQNTLRDIGYLGQSAKGVDRAVVGKAREELLQAADISALASGNPEAYEALKGARSAWRNMAQTWEDSAVGSVRESTDAGARLNTLKNKLLNDPKSAQELAAVMTPEELINAQSLILSDLTLKAPVSWEKTIASKIDSFKAIFGEEKTGRLLEMVGRDGTIGKKLLKDNQGLSSLLGKVGGKSALGALLGYEAGDAKGALLGAALGAGLSQGGKTINRAKSLIMAAAAGSPEAVKVLNSPASKMKVGEAVGRLSTLINAKTQDQPTRQPMTQQPKATPAFDAKLNKVASNIGVNPADLKKVISFETGGSFDPKQKNRAGSGATGLIQFMPTTAQGLTGAETKEAAIKFLESMTAEEQLDYVEKYLAPYKGKIKSLDDLYMAILYPRAIGEGPEYALFKEGSTAYKQNKGLDSNRDGVITKVEAVDKVRKV